jgi:hypothetical protein
MVIESILINPGQIKERHELPIFSKGSQTGDLRAILAAFQIRRQGNKATQRKH